MGAGHSKDSIVNRAYIDKLVGKTDARNDMAIRLAAMGTCNTVYVANGWDADKLCLVEHQYAAAMNYLAIYEGDIYCLCCDLLPSNQPALFLNLLQCYRLHKFYPF